MKSTIKFCLLTTYNDGAGATATYHYELSHKAFTYLAKNSWRMRAFRLTRSATVAALTSVSKDIGTGSPPATRSISISATGVITFADVHEVTLAVTVLATASDVEENVYLTQSMTSVLPTGAVSCKLDPGYTVDVAEGWDAITYCADADAVLASFTLAPAQVALGAIPDHLNVIIADTDLVTREYTGMYMEVAAKAVVTIVQAMNKKYEGIAAQGVNYLQSGNSPMALELTTTMCDMAIGADI
jgi:hypothetical protein